MKKNHLIIGVIDILIGVAFLLVGLFTDIKLSGLIFSLGGAGVALGMMLSIKYFYWSAPQNKDRYAERIENESIELHDERKERLRDKSGRSAYLIGLVIIGLSVLVFAALGQLGYITDYRIIVAYLFVYLIFQYVIGIIIYRHLDKKY